MRLKVLDVAIIAMGAAAILFAAAFVYGKHEGNANVTISTKGGNFVYPLKIDRRVDLPGPLGLTTIEIADGKVHIDASPCLNKTCIASGSISQPGQWLACLPNAILVRVGGEAEKDGVDAGTY